MVDAAHATKISYSENSVILVKKAAILATTIATLVAIASVLRVIDNS